jgi:hypothetical protein
MADTKPQRVSIGFQGGQTLVARMEPSELDKLQRSLDGGGWQDVRAVDGEIRVNVGQVVYVLVDVEEQRVGF